VLRDKENERADAAALAFGALGPKAEAAVPALTNLLYAPKNDPGAIRAGRSLANIPQYGVPILAAALTNKEPYIRYRAADSLAQVGTNARPVTSLLIQALDDNDWQVSLVASWSLRTLHPDADLAVPALTKCLEATNPVCRLCAAHVLGSLRHEALPAVPSLITALGDTNENAQRVIVDALEDIAPDAKTNDTVFVIATNALHSPHVHLRFWAAIALRNFGSSAQSEIPEFAIALKDTEPHVRAVSLATLGYFGRDAYPAVTNVQACLLDTNPMVRLAATNALFRIAPELLIKNASR
jgi:HEAT repeat protein